MASLHELAELVDLAHISRGSAKFDDNELQSLNIRLLHAMPYEAARARLAGLGVGGGQAFWLAVRGNLSRFDDARDWWRVVEGPLLP